MKTTANRHVPPISKSDTHGPNNAIESGFNQPEMSLFGQVLNKDAPKNINQAERQASYLINAKDEETGKPTQDAPTNGPASESIKTPGFFSSGNIALIGIVIMGFWLLWKGGKL